MSFVTSFKLVAFALLQKSSLELTGVDSEGLDNFELKLLTFLGKNDVHDLD